MNCAYCNVLLPHVDGGHRVEKDLEIRVGSLARVLTLQAHESGEEYTRGPKQSAGRSGGGPFGRIDWEHTHF